MSGTYEYMNEDKIDKDLICSICESPFNDPYYAPCNETYCRECITHWIQRGNNSCPHCRQTVSINVLRQAPRSLRNMLDRIPVKCITCGQTQLNRGNFDDHIQKLCPKTVVSCPSEDKKCLWRGQRDQINQHLVNCCFIPMRAIITQLIVENQELCNLVNQQTTEADEHKNAMIKVLEGQEQQRIQIDTHQNENQQLKVQINEQVVHVYALQKQIRQLEKQLQKKDTQTTPVTHQPGE
jgi:hypothetical protein